MSEIVEEARSSKNSPSFLGEEQKAARRQGKGSRRLPPVCMKAQRLAKKPARPEEISSERRLDRAASKRKREKPVSRQQGARGLGAGSMRGPQESPAAVCVAEKGKSNTASRDAFARDARHGFFHARPEKKIIHRDVRTMFHREKTQLHARRVVRRSEEI